MSLSDDLVPDLLHDLLVRSSRTFAVGIDLLPEPLRQEITVAYLLLRVSDHLEDSKVLVDGEKVALLGEWADVLASGEMSGTRGAPVARGGDRASLVDRLSRTREETPDALVARHAGAVLEGLNELDPGAREVVARRVRESTLGMARWTRRGPVFADEDDLDDYMHEVAGRVGLLLTELFALRLSGIAERRDRMMPLARGFGLGLQTVNVIRGLHEDPSRGWLYIPRSFLPDRGGSPRQIFRRSRLDAAMAVLGRLAGKADGHLAEARAYIRMIPRRHHGVRLFCQLPLLFAVRTLALSRDNPDVLHREVKMTRGEVHRITGTARMLGMSNRWLDWYCDSLATAGPAP